MADKLTEQQLLELAESELPPAGTSEDYRVWYERVKGINPDAVKYYSHLKRTGKVKPTLTQNEDGTISHTIQRVQ